MKFKLTIDSTNAKTGGIPVSTSSSDTCPNSCPMKGFGCYAEEGPMRFRWQDITDGKSGVGWKEFIRQVELLPKGQLWRHNQAGDLPGQGDYISTEGIAGLIRANEGKRGFTYTHKPITGRNARLIARCNANGFTVNLSANNHEHADELSVWGPVNLILPSWARLPTTYTPEGRKIRMCPAIFNGATCMTCQWCRHSDRDFIVGIPAHGSGMHKVNEACGYIKNSGRLFNG